MKYIQISLDVLRWIILIPTHLFPKKWEGYRRSIITGILAGSTALLGVLATLDIDLISNIICSVVQLWNDKGYVCNVQVMLQKIVGFLIIYLPLVIEALKPDFEKSIFKLPSSINK